MSQADTTQMNQAMNLITQSGLSTVCGAMIGTTVAPVNPFQKRKGTIQISLYIRLLIYKEYGEIEGRVTQQHRSDIECGEFDSRNKWLLYSVTVCKNGSKEKFSKLEEVKKLEAHQSNVIYDPCLYPDSNNPTIRRRLRDN